jgi:hypothetical protein
VQDVGWAATAGWVEVARRDSDETELRRLAPVLLARRCGLGLLLLPSPLPSPGDCDSGSGSGSIWRDRRLRVTGGRGSRVYTTVSLILLPVGLYVLYCTV